MDRFALWLTQELDRRGWSRSEAARRGEISASSLDKVIGGYAEPGIAFCKGIARAFGLPVEEVMRLAGILPPASHSDPDVAGLQARLDALDISARQAAVNIIIGILDYWDRRAAESAQKRPERSRSGSRRDTTGGTTSRADRLAQFRAMFAALSEEERKELLEELRGPGGTAARSDGPEP